MNAEAAPRGPVIGLRTWFAVLALVIGAGLVLSCRGWEWGMVKRQIRAKFPIVPQMSVFDLGQMEVSPQATKPLLLDIRTAPEYAVSHIAGARRIEPGSSPKAADLLGLPRDTLIVTYCSVGYRSSQYARELIDEGFTDVWNLEGSIFDWVNTGHTVVRGDGKEVRVVHPYDESWGRFLEPARRAPMPH